MTNFITDGTGLAVAKADLAAVPAGLDTKYVSAANWNEHRQSLLDVQAFLRGAARLFKTGDATMFADLKVYNGTPNGVLSAAKGSLCLDITTPALFQNTDGATTWAAVAGGGGGGLASPLGSSVVIQSPRYQFTGPYALAAGLNSDVNFFGAGPRTEIVLVTPAVGGSIIDSILADGSGAAPINGAKLTIVQSAINHEQIIFRNFDNSATITAANGLYINSESNLTNSGFAIGHRQSASFIYNTDRSKWQLISSPEGRFRKLGLSYEILDTGLASTNHNYAPVGNEYTSRYRLAGTNATITGIKGQSHGDMIWISNYGSTNLTLTHYDALSAAGNKFLLPSSANLVIPPYGGCQLVYDSGNGAWLLVAKGF